MKTFLRISFFFTLLLETSIADQSKGLKVKDTVGTLTLVQGEVTLLTQPSDQLHEKPTSKHTTRARFEGKYYLVKPAHVGALLEDGNVIRTAPGAQAKVVYDNGDHFYLAPGTAFKVTAKDQQQIDLIFGKMRGVISPSGPRNRLKIKTQSATMGVRGTDFFIAEKTLQKKTEVTLIRGVVELSYGESSPTEIQAGYSAIAQPTTKEDEKPIVVRRATKEDLQIVQSLIRKPVSPANEIVKKLEELARIMTLDDIKTHDSELYKKLPQNVRNADEIHGQVVANLLKDAPSSPVVKKPPRESLEESEDSVYKRYFKPID